MTKILCLILILSLLCKFEKTKAQRPDPHIANSNKVTLIDVNPKGFSVNFLYWNHSNTDITFELHYNKNTTKWILFGIKSDRFADVITGWVNDDGTGRFTDATLTPQNQLINDVAGTDWKIIDAFTKNDYRVLIFSRKIKLFCGVVSNEDVDIQTGSVGLVFATGKRASQNDGTIFDLYPASELAVQLLRTAGPFDCQNRPSQATFTSEPMAYYANHIDLIEQGVYRLYWNFTATDFVGEIHVKTKGWVALGLSPNGGMDGSDAIVAWINDDGTAHFTDRHIKGRSVIIDKQQDWRLLSSSQKNGYSIFKFTRPIVSCDQDDRHIETGSPFVIFAYGLTAPNLDIGYHDNRRGSKVVNLISTPTNKDIVIPNLEIFEMSVSNVVLPKAEDTYYYCTTFKIPDDVLREKKHLLKWEVLLPEINLPNIHHFVVYECKDDYKGEPVVEPGDCNTNYNKLQYCSTITHVWSIGGDTVSIYPKDTGYPIGGDTGYSHLVLEIHYDNPSKAIGFIDRVKIKYFMTKTLQKNELGSLTLGADLTPFTMSIPPQSSIGINSYCTKNCLSAFLNNTGVPNITIISVIPHTHLVGKEIWTKIYRKGEDIGFLHRNKNYDFNYQNNYVLNPFVTITKDDDLHTYCGYNTDSRKTVWTLAGHSTREEMCYQFLTYYPRSANIRMCIHAIPHPNFGKFIEKLQDDKIVSEIPSFDSNDFGAVGQAALTLIAKNQVTEPLKQRFKQFYETADMVNVCVGKGFDNNNPIVNMISPIRPSNVWKEPNVCPTA